MYMYVYKFKLFKKPRKCELSLVIITYSEHLTLQLM